MNRTRLLVVLSLVLLGAACSAVQAEDNEALCSRFYDEVMNKGNLDVVDELVAEDFVDHEEFPGLESGREGLKQFVTMMRAAFPDITFDVEFMMTDGDMVAAYITMSGTHKGEFMGMPPTGKKFTTKTIDIVKIVDGRAVEHWGVTDAMTMMQQLGAGPQRTSAPADVK